MRRTCVAAAFAALLACRSATPPAKGGPEARGQAIFAQQCAPCHNPDSQAKKVGPGLKGVFHLGKLSDGKPPTEPNVRALMDRGGAGMPPFGDVLTGPEKDDLVAYLKTL